jgi:Concanavalin A-like lectin/glucanases superfamily
VADPWKLICHHTYAGTPGVVYDVSPNHQNHAVVVDIHDDDFLRDGARVGSGSVRLRTRDARIEIPANASGQPLDAVRGEVTVLLETPQSGHVSDCRLIDADSFRLDVRSGGLVAWFRSYPTRFAEVTTHMDGFDPTFHVPLDRWITVSFLHDGASVMELSLDGQVVARRTGPLWPVSVPGYVTIGNARSGHSAMFGLLDDVKIWCRHSNLLEEEFVGRPMNTATAECWGRYRTNLREWSRRNSACGRELRDLGDAAVASLRRQALGVGPEERRRLAGFVEAYRALWSSGQLDSPPMSALLAGVAVLLSQAGAGPDEDPALQRLLDSDCLRRLQSEVPVPDCDRQLSAMLELPAPRD